MKKTIFWIFVLGIGLGLVIWSLGFWLGGCGNPITQFTPGNPEVISTFPASGASGVEISVEVSATFNKAMDASTINTSTFTLASAGGLITGVVTYDSSSKTVTFKPQTELLEITTYTATIAAGVKDTEGKPMETPYSWKFTTAGKVSPNTGDLDTAFAANGKMIIDTTINSIQVQSSGRIIIAGSSIRGYKPDGKSLDGNFGTDGVINPPGEFNPFNSIALDSEERILVLGSVPDPLTYGGSDLAIWRYTANGQLDDTFGIRGTVVTTIEAPMGTGPLRLFEGKSIAIDSSKRILVLGHIWNEAGGTSRDIIVLRYLPNGSLDTANFTDGTYHGYVVYDGKDGSFDYPSSITVDSSGKIFVAGMSQVLSGDECMAVWAIQPTGSLDTGFGSSGRVLKKDSIEAGGGGDCGNSITIDSSHRILVAGYSEDSLGKFRMVIWRYKSNGTPDTSFTDGTHTGCVVYYNYTGTGWELAGSNERGNSIAIDSADKILVAGWDTPSSSALEDIRYMTIWRYHPSGSLDIDFGNKGLVLTNGATGAHSDDIGLYMTIDPNDKILVAGESKPLGGSALDTKRVVWRYK